jgi:Zn-dependent protease with chaperone function
VTFAFAWLGAVLVLASYLLASSVLAGLVVLGRRSVERRAATRTTAAGRAGLLFAACVAPTAGGLAVALGLVLPAWLVYEPWGTQEPAAPGLIVLAAAAALLLGRALLGAVVEHRRTARAVAGWLRGTHPEPVGGLGVPALRVEHGFPVAAVAGVVRPRLLLGSQVVDALTPAELQAVAAHEAGHLAAGDVLKRLVLRACADPLPWGRARQRLEREWETAAEMAADEFASRQVSRVVLAKALVKIAGLVAPGSRLTLEVPAFAAGAPVATRVMGLLAEDDRPTGGGSDGRGRLPLLALAAAAAAWLAALPLALPATHALLESVVRALA